MVRGHGYIKSASDIEKIVLATNQAGTPVTVRDVGSVVLGPDIRRGVSDLDGTGEAVSGIIVMRQRDIALAVIDRVQAKLKEIEPGHPTGDEAVTASDR